MCEAEHFVALVITDKGFDKDFAAAKLRVARL